MTSGPFTDKEIAQAFLRDLDHMQEILDRMPRVVTHPTDAKRVASVEAFGVRVQASELVKPGEVLLVNPAALDVELEPKGILSEPDDLWSPTEDALRRLQYQTEVRVRVRTVEERDPFFEPMPVVLVYSWRDLPRKLWQVIRNHAHRAVEIVGYEHRKAAGQLRRHADPRDFAKLTGLDA